MRAYINSLEVFQDLSRELLHQLWLAQIYRVDTSGGCSKFLTASSNLHPHRFLFCPQFVLISASKAAAIYGVDKLESDGLAIDPGTVINCRREATD